jgi:hypothetical protein
MKKDMFSDWLKQKKDLGQKSAYDVVSHLNRVKKLVGLPKRSNAAKSIETLNSNRQFRGLTRTVKSQLRRAIRLYYMYEQQG